MMKRDDIIATHRERLRARYVVKSDFHDSRIELNPRTQLSRFATRQKQAAIATSDVAGDIIRKNAGLIGAVGVGALLFLGRRPISNWLSRMKKLKFPPTSKE
jgi:hypothetical protein